MAQGSALLKPMRADSLLRPEAARAMPEKAVVVSAPASGSPLMHPPTFAPRPAPVRQEKPADELDRLWENLSWLQTQAPAEEDPEDDGEDAVPTDQMPVPAPVPLEPLLPGRTHRRTRWVWLGVLAAAAAVGWVLWRLEWLPF